MHVSVKVKNLRKLGYANLREWLQDDNNVYVGRGGRLFIDGKVFYYPGSIWANPYRLSEYSLEESLRKYKAYLHRSPLLGRISELQGKNLGCFCEQDSECHAKVLAELANKK